MARSQPAPMRRATSLFHSRRTGRPITASFRGLEAIVQVGSGTDIELILKPSRAPAERLSNGHPILCRSRPFRQHRRHHRQGSAYPISRAHARRAPAPARRLRAFPPLPAAGSRTRPAKASRCGAWDQQPRAERSCSPILFRLTMVLAAGSTGTRSHRWQSTRSRLPAEAAPTCTAQAPSAASSISSPRGRAPLLGEADFAAASEDTSSYNARTDARQSQWSELLAAQDFRTAGLYHRRSRRSRPCRHSRETSTTKPDGSKQTEKLPQNGRAWVTGNLLNEAHNNGTPIQTNGTRLWRLHPLATTGPRTRAPAGRVPRLRQRRGLSSELSSINLPRSAETLTRLQSVRTQEFGASTDASIHLEDIALVTGGDLRDLRATDLETPYANGSPSGLQDTTARQRFFGGFGELLAEHGGWSAAASLRLDEAENLSTNTTARMGSAFTTSTPISDRHEFVPSPRIGLSRQFASRVQLHASAFRAFRTPTMNELYRTGQVGSQITLPNSALRSERATGTEGGAAWATPNQFLSAQATYFWTEINRPVSAVLLTGNTYKRENLGQIQSQGTALSAQLHLAHGLAFNFGYQYAHAIVTAFSAQPQFIGLWIPDVPRHSTAAQLRYQRNAATFTLAARESGVPSTTARTAMNCTASL